jgi:proteic killer suppression protein
MVRSIRHKGLKRLYEDDDPRGVMAEHVVKLRDILARPDAGRTVADMDVPGFRLHSLTGELKGFWAVTVRANRYRFNQDHRCRGRCGNIQVPDFRLTKHIESFFGLLKVIGWQQQQRCQSETDAR